jgi:predicted nucleic acid-binding protein
LYKEEVRLSLVVDTSVIIAVITNESHKSKLIKISKGEELIAPSSLHWEIGNAISAMFKRKRITLSQALEAIENYSLIPLRLIEVDLIRSLELAKKLDIYAYDAYFLECARYLNLPVISLDNKLISASKEIGINVIEV